MWKVKVITWFLLIVGIISLLAMFYFLNENPTKIADNRYFVIVFIQLIFISVIAGVKMHIHFKEEDLKKEDKNAI